MTGESMGLLFSAATEAELEVARLYELFGRQLPQPQAAIFFERCGGEERSHGAMVRVLKTLWEARPKENLHESDIERHLFQIRSFADEVRATRMLAVRTNFDLRWAIMAAYAIETSEVIVLLDWLVSSLLPSDMLRLGLADEIGRRPDDHVERLLGLASQMEREQPGLEADLSQPLHPDLPDLRSQLQPGGHR